MLTSEPVELSVVLPMHNEAATVAPALSAIGAQLDTLGRTYELVCVDDGSSDGTWQALVNAKTLDSRVRAVRLSRNFGKEAAMSAGLAAARGNAVLLMDADLQHPAELLPELVTRWDEGFDIVNAVKRSRGQESVFYRAFAKLFNVALGQAAGGNFQGASDFKLLDRTVVDVLLSLPEKTRFFRGLVHWVGFAATEVPFEVAPRVAGESSWGIWGLVRYSIRNLLAFSALPLRLVATLGFSTLGFAFVLGLWTLYRKLIRGDALTGFTTVILLQLILGGLLLSGVGVIALYLSAIFEELKGRPTYIVRPATRSRRQDKP